ncbi:hypothetical protein MUO74_07765 [Candidatus Bathyarchaeota archaeon]|nr:hypothetical protein [Candidatus Bathyarchaeota archaeon]
MQHHDHQTAGKTKHRIAFKKMVHFFYLVFSQEYNMRAVFQRSFTMTIVIPALLILMLVGSAPVSAISVSGAKYMNSIPPGGTDIHKMTVGIGASDDPTDVMVEVLEFGQTSDLVYTALSPVNDLSPYSARKFISLDTDTIHLEPGAKKEVMATITLPKNIGGGGRYAIIYIHAIPGKGKSFTTAVNVPVLVTVSGSSPTEAGNITRLDVGNVTIGQPISIITSFKNTGNYHYYHTVNSVTLGNANGNIIAQNSTPPSVYAIIPGNTVDFTVRPDVKDLPAGTYTVSSKILLESGRVLDEKTTAFELKESYIPPPTESSVTLSPGSPGTLTSPDGRYSVVFPQGAVLDDVVVVLKPYSRDNLHPAPEGTWLGTTCFEITGLSGLLSKNATVRVTYSANDLSVAGGDASQLKLSYWDTAQGTWVILPTQLTSKDMKLTATTNHLSVWAILIQSPKTKAPATETPLPAMLNVLALVVAAVISGCIVRQWK